MPTDPSTAPSTDPTNPHHVGVLVTNRLLEAGHDAAYEYPGFVSVTLPDDYPVFHTADFGQHGWHYGNFTVLVEPDLVETSDVGFDLDVDPDEDDPDVIVAALLRTLEAYRRDHFDSKG